MASKCGFSAYWGSTRLVCDRSPSHDGTHRDMAAADGKGVWFGFVKGVLRVFVRDEPTPSGLGRSVSATEYPGGWGR